MKPIPTTPPLPRTIACWCSGTEDPVLAVLYLTEDMVADLKAKQAELIALKFVRPRLAFMEYDGFPVRFFAEGYHGSDTGEAFFVAVAELCDDEDSEIENTGWFDLGTIAVPDAGDYRTAYEYLKVGEYGIYATGMGKHGSDEFETDDLVPLLG